MFDSLLTTHLHDGRYRLPRRSSTWSALHCLITQQVFLAAIILATDVSFDPGSPQASDRKTQVLDACDMLAAAKREPVTAREYIESNIRKRSLC